MSGNTLISPNAQGDLLTVARRLIFNGYSVVPILANLKHPGMADWTEYCKRQATDAELQQWFAYGSRYAGIGIACGYDSLIAVDLDTDDAEASEAILPLLPATIRKRGRKGWTAFLRCENVGVSAHAWSVTE